MAIDLSPTSEEAPISTQEDEPPPSVLPRSTGTSWWFRRQPPRDTLPPPPVTSVDVERTYVEQFERCIEKAVRHCMETQDARGGWAIDPDGRLFDTALVAYVLSHVEVAEAAAAVERAYPWIVKQPVQNHDPVARLLDETPRRLLVGDFSPVDLRGPTLYSDIYRRKTLLLYTIALHARVRVLSPYVPALLKDQVKRFYQRMDRIKTKAWSKVNLISVYAVLESLDGNKDAAAAVCDRLIKMQSADGSFCHNPVSTAIAFLALSAGAPDSPAWDRCLSHLLDAQRPDGTWRFCLCDVWDTTHIHRAYGDHPLYARKVAPRAVEFILASQNPDGGWGFRTDVESDNDTASCALLALREREDDPTLDAVERGIAYLLGLQRDDGLWNTWQASEDHPVEDCVAHITAAIAAFRGTHTRPIRAAQRWLEEQYTHHGRWTAGWYRNLPYSTLEVSKGLRAGHPLAHSAVRALLVLQNPDGGFPPEPGEASEASPTGLAVAALAEHYDVQQPALRKAIDWLITHQRSDGSWLGKPETYAPRPLTTHYPMETHAQVGFGLMAAWRRMVRDR